MKKARIDKLIYLLITVISLILILFLVLFATKVEELDLHEGDIAQEDIYASRAVIDEITTEKARDDARNAIEDVRVINMEISNSSCNKISEVFEKAAKTRDSVSPKEEIEETAARLEESMSFDLPEGVAYVLVSASSKDFATMQKTESFITEIMKKEVYDVADSRDHCDSKIDALSLTTEQKDAMKELSSLLIVSNYEVDEEKTHLAREAAASAVPDIEYKKNQEIVRKGAVVTEAHIEMLRTLGMLKGSSRVSPSYTTGVLLLVLICYSILFAYFRNKFRKEITSLPILSLTGLILILISYYSIRYVPENMYPIIPFGLFPGIAAIFSTPQTAIIANFIISILCGVAFDANWSLAICLIVAGTLSSYAFSLVKRRAHLLPAAIMSSVVYALTFSAMSFIESSSVAVAFAAMGKGVLGGLLSGLITIGSMQFFEMLFNATTPMKLSELTNPENKLLKKLLVEAPGSYHHALTVANISEIAARSIQADSLLARVGAYYHDIGKIRHPLYFKENQFDRNPHDDLTPEKSSGIIINHVTDGVEIAHKYRLPQNIIDIISQHHGTTTTGYFLIKARQDDPDVDEAKFTYPGPTPQTKEAAIVMLADSCEAAVRSIDDKSEEKIEAMVRKITTERVNSGQLSHCNLTFSELETVIKVITKTLGGYFHERIKYE